jgi:hypothetical protein
MVDGQVGFHRPDNVRRISVEKNGPIVRQLEKTREERHPDLYQEQHDRLREMQLTQKEINKQKAKEQAKAKLALQREKEARSYDRIMKSDKMTSTAEVKATADVTAAEEYEDDFF